jgi:hypothetical protein
LGFLTIEEATKSTLDPFPYTHPQAHPTIGLGIGVSTVSDFFVPKVEVLDNIPRYKPVEPPPPITETILRKNNFQPQQRNNIKPLYQFQHEDSQRSIVSPITSLPPPSPPYDEDTNSPTFFVDSYTKIRNLSGELFQHAGDILAKGYTTDNSKVEYYAQEILKVARQLNNSTGDDDDRKRLPPPLVRPRRIRRKHNEEEEVDDGEKRRKLGVVATAELYCHSCGTTDTPEWRRGPDGCKSLCNACGLHYAKILRRETMIPNRQPARNNMTLNNLLN